MIENIRIKLTTESDFDSIHEVEQKAFNSKEEAELCLNILKDSTASPSLSLLAWVGNIPVGHILFSRVYLNEQNPDQTLAHILAPMAVIPEYENRGIGGYLIKEGLRHLIEMNSQVVFVLGHIDYYPKYGFINNAAQFGYEPTYPIPEEVADAWMVQSLSPDGFDLPKGRVLCCDELNQEKYWRE